MVEKAKISDVAELNQISYASKKYWGYPQEWMEKWQESLTLSEKSFSDQHILKLVDECRHIIGFCAIQENNQCYEITHLWIKPSHMGRGLGKLLLQESLRQVAVKQKPILVEADPNAEAFYAKQGFTTFDQRPSYPEGRYLPLMKKEFNLSA